MIRVAIYVALIFAVAVGFAWLADNPGSLTLSFRDIDIETTVMAAAILVVAIVVIGRVLWLLIRGALRAPGRMARQAADRRREAGRSALSEGFIAVGSGDPNLASYFTAESRYYAQGEPLTLILAAQTAQLTGDEMGARAAFEAMLAKPKMRVLGFRGLFQEARRRGDADAARSFAAAADKEKPGLAWAGTALLEYQAADGEWADALETLANLSAGGGFDAARAKRVGAVLRVARAMEIEDRDPEAARDLAMEAHKLAPELVPAAVVAARLATRLGDPKRATRVLETTWKIEPHPDIAGAYMDVRSGESGRDRLKRVSHLAKIRANHIEGRLAIARAAIDAQDWPAAREELKGILATQPTGRAFVLMAEVEEAEHGDIGRARDWLSRAVRAPRDPAWTADGYVFDHWEPVSPISGRLDAFEWKVPVDRLEAVDDGAEEVAAIRDVSPAATGGQAIPAGAAEDAPPREGAGRALSTDVRGVESAALKQNGKDHADEEETTSPGETTPRQPDDPGPEAESEAEDGGKQSSGTGPRLLPS